MSGFERKFSRDALVEAVRSSSVRSILVPHGTFTMTETAQVLEKAMMVDERMDKNPKAVVLVGSLVPLGEPTSDAMDNLALALQWLKSQQAIFIFDIQISLGFNPTRQSSSFTLKSHNAIFIFDTKFH